MESEIAANIQKMLDCGFGPTLVVIAFEQEFITLRDY